MVKKNNFVFEVQDYKYIWEIDMPMTPITQSVEIYAGNTPTFTFNFTQNGSDYNLHDCEVIYSAKTSTNATSFLFQENCTISSPTSKGEVTVSFPFLSNSSIGSYVSEIQIINYSDGLTITAAQFPLEINASLDIYR